MQTKVYGLIGIARRARKVVMGESVITAIQNKNAKVVLISEEASVNTKKKISDKCQYYNITFCFVDDILLNQSLGEFNKKVIAITDEGMSKKIVQYMKG